MDGLLGKYSHVFNYTSQSYFSSDVSVINTFVTRLRCIDITYGRDWCRSIFQFITLE